MMYYLCQKAMRSLSRWSLLFFSAVLLCLWLTAWYVSDYQDYKITGSEWLTNPDFTQGLEGWKKSNNAQVKQENSGEVTLSSPVSGKHVALYQRVNIPSHVSLPAQNNDLTSEKPPLLLQLSGFAQTREIEKGKKVWHRGSLALVFYNKSGKRRVTHSVPLPFGNSEWAYYKNVFEVPPEVHSMRANVHISQVAGTVQIKRLSLVPVQLKDEAVRVKILGFVIWAVMIVWLMWGYVVCLWQRSKIGLLFISIFVIGAAVSGGIKAQLINQLPALAYPVGASFVLDWDVLAHFTLFLVAAFLLVAFFKSNRWWQVVINLMLLGLFIECLQLFVDGRTADLVDLGVDYTGIVLGVLLAVLWVKISAKISPKMA